MPLMLRWAEEWVVVPFVRLRVHSLFEAVRVGCGEAAVLAFRSSSPSLVLVEGEDCSRFSSFSLW
jgi:hypothetical protein